MFGGHGIASRAAWRGQAASGRRASANDARIADYTLAGKSLEAWTSSRDTAGQKKLTLILDSIAKKDASSEGGAVGRGSKFCSGILREKRVRLLPAFSLGSAFAWIAFTLGRSAAFVLTLGSRRARWQTPVWSRVGITASVAVGPLFSRRIKRRAAGSRPV